VTNLVGLYHAVSAYMEIAKKLGALRLRRFGVGVQTDGQIDINGMQNKIFF